MGDRLMICAALLGMLPLAVSAAPSAAAPAATARAGKWIEANHVMLRYELSGTGRQTVVMLHDMGMNLEVWDETVPAIQRNRRILRYDLRGFGLSEKFRTQVSHEDHLADLLALLDGLGIREPVVLVGQSIGGTLALKFAALHPDRVKAVVAINPIVGLKKPPPTANPNLVNRDTPKLFETQGVRAYLATDAEWLYPAKLRTPERFNRFMGIEAAQDPQVRAITMRMKPFPITEDELPKVLVPTLFIGGMINSSYTVENWHTIAAAVPHARLEMIPSAHHAAFETPELVNPLIERFLDAQR